MWYGMILNQKLKIMTIKSVKEKKGKIEINLTGPDGNAFALMSYVRQLSRPVGLEAKPIIAEMTEAKDYDELVNIFDNYFGDFVTIYK